MNWYLEAIRNYAVFSGRSRRKAYWFFFLFNVLIGIAASVLDGVLAIATDNALPAMFNPLYSLVILIPSIAVSVRRLHDTDRSGWWLLISFVPCVGFFVLLYFMIQDSTPGANRFGANPKGA